MIHVHSFEQMLFLSSISPTNSTIILESTIRIGLKSVGVHDAVDLSRTLELHIEIQMDTGLYLVYWSDCIIHFDWPLFFVCVHTSTRSD